MRIFRSWLALVVVAVVALLSTGIANAHGGGSTALNTGLTIPYLTSDRPANTSVVPYLQFYRDSMEKP